MTPRPLPFPGRRRALASAAALLALSAITLTALLAARPTVSGRVASWSGDDLATAGLWLIAVVCAAWLLLSTLACLVASASGRHAAARRFAGWAPPAARRMLQTALIGTWVLVPGAAYAVAPTTPAPLVVHVDRHGRIAPASGTGLARVPHADETPVVRAPRPQNAPPVTTTTIATPAVPVPTPLTRPSPPPVAHSAPGPARAVHSTKKYVVRAGDNLWRIAQTEVARSTGGHADDQTIARYWRQVIAANRATLRSGNPGLIFPGEIVTLP